jgi:O-acetylserine/cysteine efflux transporter
MVLLAAFFWAAANVTARAMPPTEALGLMVWSSLFSPLPLLALSFLLEGSAGIAASVAGMSLLTAGAIAYLVILSTLLGYGLWNALIMKNGAGKIAPFSLLVPVFSLSSAALFLGERFSALDALAAFLILGGLVIHVFGPVGRPQGRDKGRLPKAR